MATYDAKTVLRWDRLRGLVVWKVKKDRRQHDAIDTIISSSSMVV